MCGEVAHVHRKVFIIQKYFHFGFQKKNFDKKRKKSPRKSVRRIEDNNVGLELGSSRTRENNRWYNVTIVAAWKDTLNITTQWYVPATVKSTLE